MNENKTNINWLACTMSTNLILIKRGDYNESVYCKTWTSSP